MAGVDEMRWMGDLEKAPDCRSGAEPAHPAGEWWGQVDGFL